MREINIRLFGAFRNYCAEESITLTVTVESTAVQVRQALKDYFISNSENFDEKLVEESMLATNEKVLELNDSIPAGQSLAILPPVCGG